MSALIGSGSELSRKSVAMCQFQTRLGLPIQAAFWRIEYHGLTARLSVRVVVATVRGDEHGDGRPAIGFDFVVVLCFRLIEACDHQEIGSFEKRGKQAGGPERIGH